MTDKEKILAEIERLKSNLNLDSRHDQGVSDGLHAISKFIKSLEEKNQEFYSKLAKMLDVSLDKEDEKSFNEILDNRQKKE